MRTGVRLGVDVGSVRVGISRSDPAGVLASPVETVRRGPDTVGRLAELVVDLDAVEVVVGLPTTLAGQQGRAAESARSFAREVAEAVQPTAVRLVDERLTTVSAQRDLHRAGMSSRRSRAVVDQAAAVVILQAALDSERTAGRPPGELLSASDRAATGEGTT